MQLYKWDESPVVDIIRQSLFRYLNTLLWIRFSKCTIKLRKIGGQTVHVSHGRRSGYHVTVLFGSLQQVVADMLIGGWSTCKCDIRFFLLSRVVMHCAVTAIERSAVCPVGTSRTNSQPVCPSTIQCKRQFILGCRR